MESTALRQLLKNLCSNSPWKYAVFWKLEQQSRMILAWEDGYVDYPKPKELLDGMTTDIYPHDTDENSSSSWETVLQSGGYAEDSVGLALAEISCLQYVLGEGFIGRVADADNYCWVLLDNILTCTVTSECPDEWFLQYESGIKTILLVPVLPHGVLQLGSLEVLADDQAEVAYIKERFNAVQIALDKDVWDQPASFLLASIMEDLDEPSAITINRLEEEADDIKPELSSTDHSGPFSVHGTPPISGRFMPEDLVGNKFHILPVIPEEPTALVERCIVASQMDVRKRKLYGPSEEELIATSQDNFLSSGFFGESFSGIYSNSDGHIEGEMFGDYSAFDERFENMDFLFSFPSDCELHSALNPAFKRQADKLLWESSLLGNELSSNLVCETDFIDSGNAPYFAIEGVLTNENSNLNDDSPNKLLSDKLITSSGQFVSQSELSSFRTDYSSSKNNAKFVGFSRGREAFDGSSTSRSLMSMLSAFIVNEQDEKRSNTQTNKGLKTSNRGGRKGRHGDNQRPRPRDRQLIQDRVKELRQLVPSGAKCSIDGLLERTIKHMKYLKNITDQAEKVKQLADHKVSIRKNLTSPEARAGSTNGASWAYELGYEQQVCPILIEDLDQPGHMLIEMLCDSHDELLDIAQIIRRLDLTILKGVMECDSHGTWAHFIIEASRGFHRMDIFWPLMHLLQRKKNPNLIKI